MHTSLASRLTLVGLASLAALAVPALGQPLLSEGFDNVGQVVSPSSGPANLINRGWIFRNQSQPLGSSTWRDGFYVAPQSGGGHLEVDLGSTGQFGGDVSNWAILPAVAGQGAGDQLSFYTYGLTGSTAQALEVRYSPTGGTGTGSGTAGIGDFTQVLLSLSPVPTNGWNLHTVTIPGSGRIALRYIVDDGCTLGCFIPALGIDSLTVGEPLPPPCNLPPVPSAGQTVTWTAADSPYEVCENIAIPPGSTVIVEPGVVVNFNQDRQLNVGGTLRLQGTALAPIILDAPSVFPPYIVVQEGTLEGDFTDFGQQLHVRSGATVLLDGCTFTGPGTHTDGGLLIVQELQAVRPYVRLDRCTFDGSLLSVSDATFVLGEGNSFTDTSSLILRGYADVTSPGNTVSVRPLEIIRERESLIQGLPVDNISASGVATGAGLVLSGGEFKLGAGVSLQNNLYPVRVEGGLTPDSTVPLTGNTVNAVDVGVASFFGRGQWPSLGVPYRISEALQDIPGGDLRIAPGVVVEGGVPGAVLFARGGRRMTLEGTDAEPIVFRSASPGQRWTGVAFDLNAQAAPRLDRCEVSGAEFGALCRESTLFVDNTTLSGNEAGANTNSFGATFFSKTIVTGNAIGLEVSETGSMFLDNAATPNAIEGNAVGVDAFSSGSDADARSVWWGDPSGPQHPNNPGGSGDSVIGPGALGIEVLPFLTSRPDFTDTPPLVRLVELAPDDNASSIASTMRPGDRLILRWGAADDAGIISQRVLVLPGGPGTLSEAIVVADDLDGDDRSVEITVPDVGFIVTNLPQVIRIEATDTAGQVGWDHMPVQISSGRLSGSITIDDSAFAGMTFTAGDPIPEFTFSGSVNDFPSFSPFILFESDGAAYEGVRLPGNIATFVSQSMPAITTDRARIALRAANNSNDVIWFFSENTFSIRHDPRLGFEAPAVAVTSPAPGATVTGGSVVNLGWTAGAPEGLRSFDILASYDGGRTHKLVAEDLPGSARSFAWRLPPSGGIPDVRVRVVARDERFQNAAAEVAITIAPGTGCAADWSGDGVVNSADISAFLTAWLASVQGGTLGADFNADMAVNSADISAFLTSWLSAVQSGC